MTKQESESRESKPEVVHKVLPQTQVVRITEERKAGDQGIILQAVGTHETDPFAAQDGGPAGQSEASPPAVQAPVVPDASDSSTPQGGSEEG